MNSSVELDNYFQIKSIENEDLSITQESVKDKPISFENYICIICDNVVYIPKNCKECEILLCAKCFSKTIKFDKRCPNCRKELIEGNLPRIVKNTLNEIRIRCPFLCDEIIKICNLKNHFDNTCSKMKKVAECLVCKKEFQYNKSDLSNLLKHISICSERKVKCEFCDVVILTKNVNEHLINCEERIIECPSCLILLKNINKFPHDTFVCQQIKTLRAHSQNDKKDCEIDKTKNFHENKEEIKKIMNKYTEFNKQIPNTDIEIEHKKDEKFQVTQELLDKKIDNTKASFNIIDDLKSKIEPYINGDYKLNKNSIINNCVNNFSKYFDKIRSTVLSYSNDSINTSKESDNIIPVQNIKQSSSFIPSEFKELFIKQGHKSEVNSIIFINDDVNNKLYLASAGDDFFIKIWDLETYLYTFIIVEDLSVYALLNFKSNIINLPYYKNLLISAGSEKDIKIFDFSTKKLLYKLNGHSDSIICLEKLNNKKNEFLIASGGLDAIVIIWDIYIKDIIYKLKSHQDSVNSIVFLNWEIDDFTIASAGSDKTINIWNIQTGVLIKSLTGHQKSINDLSFMKINADNFRINKDENISIESNEIRNQKTLNLIISCSWDQTIRFWDCSNFTQIKLLKAHNISVMCSLNLKISESEVILISAGFDKTIKFWNIKTEECIGTLYGHMEKIKKINKTLIKKENKILIVSGGIGDDYGSIKGWIN